VQSLNDTSHSTLFKKHRSWPKKSKLCGHDYNLTRTNCVHLHHKPQHVNSAGETRTCWCCKSALECCTRCLVQGTLSPESGSNVPLWHRKGIARLSLMTLYAALAVSPCWLAKSYHSQLAYPRSQCCTCLLSLLAHSLRLYPEHSYEGHLALCMSATASKAGTCSFEAELINQHDMQGLLMVRAFHRVVCSEPSEKPGKGLLVGAGASALPKFLMTPSCLKLDAHSR